MKISVMSWKMWFMKALNIAGALVSPIGMTRNSKEPYRIWKSVFHLWLAMTQTL